MQRTTTPLARLLAALVVALLVALAGTTTSYAESGSAAGASTSRQHHAAPAVVAGAAHRHLVTHRHVGTDLAAWTGTAGPADPGSRPLAAPQPGHGPVLQTSFCSSDRAPPV